MDNEFEMEVSVTLDGDDTIVAIAGELDALTSTRLRQIVMPLLGPGDGRIVVDLVGVGFLGTRGAQTILDLHRLAREAGRGLSVRGLTRQSRRAMRLVDVDEEVPEA